MMGRIDSHHIHIRLLSILFCVLVCLSFVPGCARSSKFKRSANHLSTSTALPAGGLKKQIGIVPFYNRSFFTKQNFEEILQKEVVDTIKSGCSGVRLITAEDSDSPEFLTNLLLESSGKVDNIAIAEAGRKSGMNAFLFGSLTHISEKMEKEGILWYKDTVYYVQIGIRVEVYDTETGSKLLDESVVREIEIDEIDADLLKKNNEIMIPGILDAILEIGAELADMACDTIRGVPWRGYIVDLSGDNVILSSGQSAGIKKGQRFKVYKRGGMIEGKDGHRFYLPGTETGEIKIVSVFPNRAEAVSVSGDVFLKGASVRRD
jgi:hypothetical protein